MLKILSVVGARPQFVKYFPFSEAAKRAGGTIEDVLVHTGQHYDYKMSRVFFDEFGIAEPRYHLGVGSDAHGQQTANVISRVEKVIDSERPDVVLVFGDTNSTLGAAVAASKAGVSVGHVEAGLRSFNKRMPEEINRVLSDHVSSVLFCPSAASIANLRAEGFREFVNNGELVGTEYFSSCLSVPLRADINNPIVVNVGDIMFDVLIIARGISQGKSRVMAGMGLEKGEYCLLTVHRAENTDDKERLAWIVDAVGNISEGKRVVFPMHPRTRKRYMAMDKKFGSNVDIIDPVGYFDSLALLENARMLMTDSGGMQKEAFWMRVPCVTLREETEWVETVETGWNVLYKNYCGRLRRGDERAAPYGGGAAADLIVGALIRLFGGGENGK